MEGPPSTPLSPRAVVVLLSLEVLLCVGTGFWRLGRLSYWDDEVTSIDFARETPAEIWADRDPNNSPFYYELLHVWRGLVGEDEAALRSLSAGSRVLGLLAVFWMASVMLDPRRALVAGLLYVLSPAALLYGREVRAYPLLLAACAAAMAALWLARERKSFRWACVSGGFLSIALMMHYSTLFLVGGLATVHLIPSLRKAWVFFGVAVLVMGMSILPWGGIFVENIENLLGAATGAEQVPIPFGPPGKAAYALFVLVLGETVLPWRWIVVAPAAIASAVLGVRGLRTVRSDLCLLLVLPVILSVLVLSFTMKAGPRYVFLVLPLLLVLFAAGVRGTFGNVALGILLACEGVSLANLHEGREYHNEAYLEPSRDVAALLRGRDGVRPSDVLVLNCYAKPLHHYLADFHEPTYISAMAVFSHAARSWGDEGGGWDGKTVWLVERSPGRASNADLVREETTHVRNYLKASDRRPHEWPFGPDPDAAEKERWVGKPFLRTRIVVWKFETK